MDPTYLGQPIPTPTASRPSGIKSHRIFLIILVLVIAVIVGMLLIFAGSDSTGTLQQRLSARQETTLKLVQDGQKNISGGDLSKLNSELTIVLIGDNAAIQAALTSAGLKEVDKAIVAAEADNATFEQLKSAKLNAQYDTTYRRVLTQKIESLRSLLQELHKSTKIQSLKPPLAAEYEHLGTYLNALTIRTP
jgi:hypothetical protein